MSVDQKKPKGYRKAWDGGRVPSQRYVVATSMEEAETVAREMGLGYALRSDAERHLADVKAPPTDSFYAQKYKIFVVGVRTD